MNRSHLRNYIKKIILETFYVDPSGNAMSAEEAEANEPGFMGRKYTSSGFQLPDDPSHWPSWVDPNKVQTIEDTPGTLKSHPNQRKVKEILTTLDEETKEKLSRFIFKNDMSINDLTGNLGDDQAILRDAEFVDQEFLNSAEMIFDSLDAIDLYKYITYYKDDFITPEDVANFGSTFDYEEQGLVADYSDNPFFTLFRSVNPGKIGMGKTLMGKLLDIVEQSLENLNNETPDEFHDKVYPRIERIINSAFKKMPHIQKNMSDDLVRAKDAYLEAISYVLRELIGELNFESVYFGESDEPMFIPADKSVFSAIVKKEEDRRKEVNRLRVARGMKPYEWDDMELSEIFSELRGNSRSDINYYSTKFSKNPVYRSVIDAGDAMNYRIYSNIILGHGSSEFGFDIDWEEKEEISNRWYRS